MVYARIIAGIEGNRDLEQTDLALEQLGSYFWLEIKSPGMDRHPLDDFPAKQFRLFARV